MIWALVIATTINGTGQQAAEFDSATECDRAAMVITWEARRAAEKNRGQGEEPDVYARCEARQE